MNLLLTILLLLICLLISNIISHYIPFIPTALIQIALGIIIALIFRNISFQIETEWFLLLFVAPLLYNDGRHFPREELWKMKAPILGNAVVLVLVTTVSGGYFIHWLIPNIPISAALALAAVLSPTDPVAVNGIAKRIHIPEKVLTLVRGESLINDASGLVAFNYAVTAVVTGSFSLKVAAFDFTYKFIAGVILGLILGFFIIWIRYTLHKKGIGDMVFHSLLQILTPFIIYIITEELFHASGVISVVFAGIFHSFLAKRTGSMMAEEKVLSENVWSVVLFVLNGIVFILLGLIIPSSMSDIVKDPNIGNWLAIGYVFAIGSVILEIRFIWSYLYSLYRYYLIKKDAEKPSIKNSLLVSLTGVRGAVAMAGAISIPYLLANGKSFPERSLIIFIAAGVILFTLIAATVLLPLLSKEKSREGKETNKMDLTEAKVKVFQAAIIEIRKEMNEDNALAAYELIDEYKIKLKKIQYQQNSAKTETYQQRVKEIRLLGLKAERKYIHDLIEDSQMNKDVSEIFEASLDHREEVLSNNVRSGVNYIIENTIRSWKRYRVKYRQDEEKRQCIESLGKDIQLEAFQAAIESLEKYANNHGREDIVQEVILDYKGMIKRLKTITSQYNEKKEEQKEELRINAMDNERYEIRKIYESGEISNEQAKRV